MGSRTDLNSYLNQTLRALDEEIQSKRRRLAELRAALPLSSSAPSHRSVPLGRLRLSPRDTTSTEYCSLPQYIHRPKLRANDVPVDLSSTLRQPLIEKSLKPVVQPDNYDGSKSFEDWLTNLNLCSQINGWSLEQKTKFLAVRLRGPALQVYTDLADSSKLDFSAIVNALKDRFSPQGQSGLYRAKLKVRTRRKSEKLPELASDIRRLVSKAYPDVSAELREELGRDHFIEALDLPEIRMQVRRAKPRDLGAALTAALEEEAFIQVEYNKTDMLQRIGANACQSKPIITTAIPEPELLDQDGLKLKVHQLEQTVKELQTVLKDKQASGRFRRPRGPIICWNCRQEGHRQFECPFNAPPPNQQQVIPDTTNNGQGNQVRLSMGPMPSHR